MKKNGIKFLAAFLGAILVASLAVTAPLLLKKTRVHAAGTGVDCTSAVTLDTLANQGKLKLLGRTVAKSGYLQTEFSGTGFETKVNAFSNADVRIVFRQNYAVKWNVLVDGESVLLETYPAYDGILQFEIPEGEHTLTVMKESQLASTTTAYCKLESITFDGEVLAATPNKAMLIEVIGDSYSCGDGAAASFDPGVAWSGTRDDQFSLGFASYLAGLMDADLTFAGRGGQGLDGSDAQESQTNTIKMPALYDCASYADVADNIPYVTTRKANLVVVELGANDSCTSANKAAWVAIAKDFIKKIKTRHGDVPIVWVIQNQKNLFYSGLLDLFANDAELSKYDNLYVHWTTMGKSGSAALATQTGGHPNAVEQESYATSIYRFILANQVLPEAEETYTDTVVYVSQSGDNATGDGTAAKPYKTIQKAMDSVRIALSDTEIPAGTRVVIRVTGTVTLTGAQNIAATFGPTTILKDTNGEMIPFIIETKDFDGTNRAVLTSTYAPTNSGSSTSYSVIPLEFKNVKLNFTGSTTSGTSTYKVNKIYNQNGDLTFNNTTVAGVDDTKISVYANGFSYTEAYHKGLADGSEPRRNEMIFKNGVYDATTGFGTIAALGGTNSYYSSAGSKTSMPGLSVAVRFQEGAVVDASLVKMVADSTMSVDSAAVFVEKGAKLVGTFVGTQPGTSTATKAINTNVEFIMHGGMTEGAFYQLGNYTKVNGNVTFLMYGGLMRAPAAQTQYDNSIVLGGSENVSTITGDCIKNILIGQIYVTQGKGTDGKAFQASVHFSGRANQTIQGNSINNIGDGSYYIDAQDASVTTSTSAFYLGSQSGAIQGTLQNNIQGGVFDSSMTKATYYFGGQAVSNAINHIVNRVGVIDIETEGNLGPVFNGAYSVNLGSGWGQFGVTAYSKTAVAEADRASKTKTDVVVENYIYGGQFGGPVYLTPNGTVNTSNAYYPRVEGSCTTEIWNGMFNDSVYVKQNGEVYGHVKADIYGGYFTNIYGMGSNAAALITDGLELGLYGGYGYGKVTKTEYNLDVVNAGKITAVNGGDALKLTVGKTTLSDGFFGRMNLLLDDANGVVSGTYKVSITDGAFGAVTGAMAAGSVKGGMYKVQPDAAMLAAGTTFVTFDALVDQYFTCAVNDGSIHTHCVCNQESGTLTGHDCDAVVWTPVYSEEDLAKAFSATAPTTGHYVLMKDVKLTAALTPQAVDMNISLCLNGHEIAAAIGKRAIQIYNSSKNLKTTLNITDCADQEEKPGRIYGGFHTANGPNVLVFGESELNLFGGVIEDGQSGYLDSKESSGGNITADGTSQITIYGGVVRNGRSYGHGGNIHCQKMTMYGGRVEGGYVFGKSASPEGWNAGGNIYLATGTGESKFYGGTIANGRANYGGNMYTNSTVLLDGVTITGGEAVSRNGGNIFVDNDSVLRIAEGEGTVIENGSAVGKLKKSADVKVYGGNIQLQGTLEMNGGVIRNGQAGNCGGNIATAATGTPITLHGGVITDGTARIGGNIYLGATMNMDGGSILNGTAHVAANNADGHGGQIYIAGAGILNLSGGEILNGTANNRLGGAAISSSSTGQLNMTGGTISGGYGEDGNVCSSLIHFWNNAGSVINISGGTIKANTNEAVALLIAKSQNASITDGDIYGQIAGDVTGYIEGGHFATEPSALFVKDGYVTILEPDSDKQSMGLAIQVVAGGYVYTTAAMVEGQMAPVMVIGGGVYLKGQEVIAEAPDLTSFGLEFVRWEQDGEAAYTGRLYKFPMEQTTSLVAVYKRNVQTLHLNVSGSNYEVTIGTDEPLDVTGAQTFDVPNGSEVTVEFLNEDVSFVAWVNDSNKYVSTAKKYTFTMNLNTELKAKASASVGNKQVIYLNGFQQILFTDTLSQVPDTYTYAHNVPVKYGMKNGRWDKTGEEILALLETQDVVQLNPVYDPDEDMTASVGFICTELIAADGDALTTSVLPTVGDETTARVDTLYAMTAPAIEGYNFLCFAKDGKVVSYANTIEVRPSNVLYQAVYTTEDVTARPTIANTFVQVIASDATRYTVQLDVNHNIPEGYELVEQGIIFTSQNYASYDEVRATLFLDGMNVKTYRSSGLTANSTTSIRLKNIELTKHVFMRGYAVYKNADGELGTIYSSIAYSHNGNVIESID